MTHFARNTLPVSMAVGMAAGAAAILSLGLGADASAGAWTATQGTSYNKVSFNYYSSNSSFGVAPGFERFEDINVTYYGEYGILDSLTVLGSIPFRRIENRAFGETTDNGGAGDVEVGLRYNLVRDPVVTSFQIVFKAPYLYDEDNELPLGNGQEDVEFRVQFGKSFGRFGYGGIEAAYRVRFQEPSDEFRYLIEYGFDATERLYLRTKLDAILAIDSTETVIDDASGNPQIPLAFNLGKVEATVGWKFSDRFSAEFIATTNPFGDNIIRGTTYQVALIAAF